MTSSSGVPEGHLSTQFTLGAADVFGAQGPLGAVLDRVPTAVALSHADGRFAYTNAAWKRRFSRTGECDGRAPQGLQDLFDAASVHALLASPALGRGEGPQRHTVQLCEGLTSAGQGSSSLPLEVEWHDGSRGAASPVLSITVDDYSFSETAPRNQLAVLGARLVGEISHDLNNELSILLNYTFVLGKRIVAGHPLAELLGEVQRAAWRVSGVTQGLVRAGRSIERRDVRMPLAALVDGALPLLRVLAGDKCTVSVEIDAPATPCVLPRARLEQLLARCVLSASDGASATFRRSIPQPLIHIRLTTSDRGAADGVTVMHCLQISGVPQRTLLQDSEYSAESDGSVVMNKIREAVCRCGGEFDLQCHEDGFGQVRVLLPVAAQQASDTHSE